jgi:hypothetical protein
MGTTITLSPDYNLSNGVTRQSLNSLMGWVDSRGGGEALPEALRELAHALHEGREVTITLGAYRADSPRSRS